MEQAAPCRVVRLVSIDSTNEEAMRQARAGVEGPLAIVADSQSAGRGRHGNRWQSPVGNLHVSILLHPDLPAARIGELAFVAAVAGAETIDAFLGAGRAALKWPNDVLVDDAKIAGILIESELEADRVSWMVVGVGINIASVPEGLPYAANSLHLAGAGQVSRDEVLSRFLANFDRGYTHYLDDGFAAVRQAWIKSAWRLGNIIAVDSGDQHFTGRFAGIDTQGALLLQTSAGERRIVSGSVAYQAVA